ncbi:MAG: LamG domain-containing protein [Nannocystaceae bacterium]|nr:LamG domain-containing protein [Nannocystaceae bacterium]
MGSQWTRWAPIGLLAWAGAAVGAACIPIGSFACTDDAECGSGGWCEDTRFCSSRDDDCESGRRYSRYASTELASRCVQAGGTTGSLETDAGPQETVGPSDPSDGTTRGPPGVTDEGSTSTEDDTASTGTGDPASACIPPGRDAAEPVLLYDFCEGEGTVVSSITETDLDLEFENGAIGKGFTWVADGLRLDGDATAAHTAVRSSEPVFGRLQACIDSGEATLEVWATPLAASQGGPTGIVVLGPTGDGTGTDFDLALRMNPEWDVSGYVASFKTSESSALLEWIGTPFLTVNHLVLVHDAETTTLYLDGEVLASEAQTGSLSAWDPNFDLVLGNLTNYDVRNWRGTYHLVAIYCEALSLEQVQTNFAAGHRPR